MRQIWDDGVECPLCNYEEVYRYAEKEKYDDACEEERLGDEGEGVDEDGGGWKELVEEGL